MSDATFIAINRMLARFSDELQTAFPHAGLVLLVVNDTREVGGKMSVCLNIEPDAAKDLLTHAAEDIDPDRVRADNPGLMKH